MFCAIDGELAGIFALNYTLPDVVFPALDSLMREKVGPVLATRDFNLIPSMLHQRFKLGGGQDGLSAGGAPPGAVSDPDQPHSETITAVLCREGAAALCRRGWWGPSACGGAPGSGAALTCVGFRPGGLLLAYYLTAVDAYGSLSPLNLLVFLLFWVAPRCGF